MVGAPQGQADAMLEAVQKRWKGSSPETVTGDKPMKFCGYEMVKVNGGYFPHQAGYLTEVLKRHQVECEVAPKSLLSNPGTDGKQWVWR